MVGRKHFIIIAFALSLVACSWHGIGSGADTEIPDHDVYPAFCGNGIKDAGEECDDGNLIDGDGCDPHCKIGVVSVCGNGVKEPGEACDGDTPECADISNRYRDGTAYCYHDCRGYNITYCEEYPPWYGDGDCTLVETFFDEMPTDWSAFFTMKMSGFINDPANNDSDFASVHKIGAKLKGTMYNLGDYYGMYMLDSVQTGDGQAMPAVIAVGVGPLTWPVADKLAILWAGQIFMVVDDLLNWKTQADTEGMTGVMVDGTYQVVVYEVWTEITNNNQFTRMECVRGLSAMNADETAYDGAMFVCTDANIEWDVGEIMRMMDYSKMLDQDADILAVLNEGLEVANPNYRTDVCRCWEQDGVTLMNCEEMKDEFGLGELPDDDALTSDDDVLVEWCGNGIMESGEECETGMNLPCVEIDPVLYPNGAAPCKDDCSGWDSTTCVEQNNGSDGAIPDE